MEEVIGSHSTHVDSDDLGDLERQDTRGQIFLVDLHNYVCCV